MKNKTIKRLRFFNSNPPAPYAYKNGEYYKFNGNSIYNKVDNCYFDEYTLVSINWRKFYNDIKIAAQKHKEFCELYHGKK